MGHPTIRLPVHPLILALFLAGLPAIPYSLPVDDGDPSQFTICRLKYKGGGDWYSDPSSLPNLLQAVAHEFGIPALSEEIVRDPTDPTLREHPFLYMTGHGNVVFSAEDVRGLRAHLESGGFLWADDNYGMHESFRREIRKLFPDESLEPLSAEHPVFHSYFDFPDGLPAVHEHDPGVPPQAFGVFHDGRMVVLYTYQSDIGDGLEDPDVHNDPPAIREQARKMALNIVWYSMTH